MIIKIKTYIQASRAMEGVKMVAQVELQEHVIHSMETANAMRLTQEIPVMVNIPEMPKFFRGGVTFWILRGSKFFRGGVKKF